MSTERTTFSTRRFLVGKAGPFPRLVFREEVMLALDQFSHLHSQGEHGGFLVGRMQEIRTSERFEILVERFVPVPQRSDATRLVIHQDHLRTVELALKEGEAVVGWAHTHPGFGVFLSSFDKDQHQRFFPEPWQIAYVMDTQANERVAYCANGDEWRRLEGYYILRDMAAHEVGITAREKSSPWLKIAIFVLALALLGAGVTMGVPVIRDLMEKAKPAGQHVFEPEPAILEREATPTVTASSQVSPEASSVSVVPESRPETTSVPENKTIAPPPTVPRYIEYVVQRGDSLWSIAGALWGDSSLFRVIAGENDITNPSSLRVGMVLRVPVDPQQR